MWFIVLAFSVFGLIFFGGWGITLGLVPFFVVGLVKSRLRKKLFRGRRRYQRASVSPGPTNVYALTGALGDYLYIGVTVAGREWERWAEHTSKPWFHEVQDKFVMRTCNTRKEALSLERHFIKTLRPRYNKVHNT